MCIAIFCKPGCDVMNFEVNLIFLINPFFREGPTLICDIKKNDGIVLVAGLISDGVDDAEIQLDIFKEIVNEKLGKSVGDDNHFVKNDFSLIKNLMSDRCATQTNFNKIFTEFRCSVLPDIVFSRDTLTSEQQ